MSDYHDKMFQLAVQQDLLFSEQYPEQYLQNCRLIHTQFAEVMHNEARKMSKEEGTFFLAVIDAKMWGKAFNFDLFMDATVADRTAFIRLMQILATVPDARKDLLIEAKEKYKP